MSEERLRAELNAVYASISWKITAPLRLANALLRRVFSGLRQPRQAARRLAVGLVHFALRRPWLARLGKAVFERFPVARQRVLNLALQGAPVIVPAAPVRPVHALVAPAAAELSPAAQMILSQLHQAIKEMK